MTVRETEKRLLVLSERYRKTPKIQAEYRALHKRWMQAKAQQELVTWVPVEVVSASPPTRNEGDMTAGHGLGRDDLD